MMNFTIPKKVKTMTMVLMAIGVIGLILGINNALEDHTSMNRFWANLLVDGFLFFALALGALFFYALQYTAEVGWSSQIKRVLEAIFSNMWVGMAIMLLVFGASTMHKNDIYHWMDSSTTNEYVVESVNANGSDAHTYYHEMVEGAIVNTHYDKLIAGKSAYLNTGFWWLRTLVYFGVFLLYGYLFRKMSLKEDETEGNSMHIKMFKRSAVFLVFFSVFSSTMTWDWLMSIDVHWFSTMYGWLTFASYWNMAMVFTTLLVLWLRHAGFMPNINDSHIHDLGKWVFATGLLWVYLWFSQFMLIWYADIPEETPYYMIRMFGEYKYLYFSMILLNFVMPFVVLMSRDAKRNPVLLIIVGVILFATHFVDFYLLVIPGVVFDHWHSMEIYEVLMFIGFLGLFIFLVMRSLTKAPLIPKNHPFLDESEHHSV